MNPAASSDKLFTVGDHRVNIPGPAGPLQAVLSVPESLPSGTNFPTSVAVICHPHSLMGGSLDNKVVFTLHRACRDQGLATIRFNFRGVGSSEGVYDHGVGEQDDLLAVLAWAGQALGATRLMLAGFSFGSFVAASAWPRALAAGWQGGQLLLVAPPVTRFPLQGHELPAGARVIYGDADEVVDPVAIRDWLAAQPQALDIHVLSGAGHFFHGRLSELKDWVAAGLQTGMQNVQESVHD